MATIYQTPDVRICTYCDFLLAFFVLHFFPNSWTYHYQPLDHHGSKLTHCQPSPINSIESSRRSIPWSLPSTFTSSTELNRRPCSCPVARRHVEVGRGAVQALAALQRYASGRRKIRGASKAWRWLGPWDGGWELAPWWPGDLVDPFLLQTLFFFFNGFLMVF